MIKSLIAAVLLTGMATGAAFAQTNPDTPVVDQRLQDQQQRVDQGLSSGQLTQGEATKLQNRDSSIAAQAQADAAKDGSNNLTAQQRKQLRKREDRTSAAIYRKKHNATTQGNTAQ